MEVEAEVEDLSEGAIDMDPADVDKQRIEAESLMVLDRRLSR